jgi:hypothetical protein
VVGTAWARIFIRYRGVGDIYSLLGTETETDVKLTGFWRRREARSFINHFFPEESPITRFQTCREERLNDLWLQKLLPCSAAELVEWHQSTLDGTAWQRAKAELCQGREWCAYDDYLLNIERNSGREKRPEVWVRIS